MQANGFQVPAIKQNILEIIIEDNDTLFAMTNYIMMAKSGKSNPIEEEKYMAALKAFHANYLKRKE